MIKHVSVFRLKADEHLEENKAALVEMLNKIPETVPTVISSEVGAKFAHMPSASPDGAVQFYDVIQIIGFRTMEDCMAYPTTPGHMALFEASTPLVSSVIGMEYQLD